MSNLSIYTILPNGTFAENAGLYRQLADGTFDPILTSTLITPGSVVDPGDGGGGNPSTETRVAFYHPFSASSPFNTGISTTASYGLPTVKDTNGNVTFAGNAITDNWLLRAGNPPPSGNAGTGSGQVNGGTGTTAANFNSYGVTASKAASGDPTYTITNTGSGPASISIQVDPDMDPPTGTDMNTVLVLADGVTAYEFYRLKWNTGRTALSCTRIVGPYNLKTHDGLTNGIRAAGIKLLNGLIRQPDLDKVTSGVRDDFGHALAMSIPKEHLKQATPHFVPPANTFDNQTNVPYTGIIPMGALFAIPPSLNAADAETGLLLKAFANTLERYGVYVTDQSTTWTLYLDQNVSETVKASLKTAWRARLMGKCRYITSNTSAVGWGGGPAPRLATDPPAFV